MYICGTSYSGPAMAFALDGLWVFRRRRGGIWPLHDIVITNVVLCMAYRGVFGLYTILLLPMVYCVWHTKGGSGRSRLVRSSRAIV